MTGTRSAARAHRSQSATGTFVAPPYVRFKQRRGSCEITDLRNKDRYTVRGIDTSLARRLVASGRWTPPATGSRASVREWVQAASLAQLGALRATGPSHAPGGEDASLVPVQPSFLGRSSQVRAGAGPRVAIVGCPWDFRMGRAGAAAGPAVIRSASRVFARETAAGAAATSWISYDLGETILDGVDIVDLGDVNAPPITDYDDLAPRVDRAFATARGLGALPVVLGGDHGLTLLSLKALRDVPLAVVHVDAHDDFLEDDLHHGSFLWHASRLPHVRTVHLAGLRGICRSSGSRAGLVGHPHVLTARDWRANGVEAFVDALSDLPVYLSIDIDVLDPAFAPGTRSPRGGGIDLGALLTLLGAICARRQVVGADLMEVSSPRTSYDFTPFYAVEILMSLLHLSTFESRRVPPAGHRTGTPGRHDR